MSLLMSPDPVKPASPQTDLEEFYAITDMSNFEKLKEELGYWQFFYNWQRPCS